MTTYLEGGWYEAGAEKALRSEVIDGAMDIAGTLLRSEVPPEVLRRIALRVRSLVTVSDPMLRGHSSFGERERSGILLGIEPLIANRPELAAFMADCVEHVGGTTDLFALYLHLVHVTRMMQLLSVVAAGDVPPTRPGNGARAAPAERATRPKRAAKKRTSAKRTSKAAPRAGSAKKKTGRGKPSKKR